MLALIATKQPLSKHCDFTSFNLEGFAADQGIGHFPVGGFDDPAEGGPGDSHALGSLFLIQTLQVGQPDGFKFIDGHHDFVEGHKRDAPGFEVIAFRLAGNPAAAKRSCHNGGTPSQTIPL
jgi:hypothetical protein